MDRTTDRTPIARAPTTPRREARRRSAGRPVRRRVRHAMAGLSIVTMALIGAVAVPAGAQAATYPTWDELQAAKSNTAAGAAAVQQITALIAQLETNVAVTRAEAERRTDELIVAQQKYDDAVMRADQIQAQADASAAEAAAAERNAGQVAAQLYRAGTGDVGVNLFLDAGNAAATEALLAKLGSMEKMVERTSGIYDRAQEKQNAAPSLADQAEVARAEREKLRIAAEEALVAAQEAQAAAEAALAESQAKKIELDQQLTFLKDTEAKTTAAYEEGERIRKAEEERRRQEEERRRQEAIQNGSPGAVAARAGRSPACGRITSGLRPSRLDLLGGGLLELVPLRSRPRHRMLRADLRREQRRRALRRVVGHLRQLRADRPRRRRLDGVRAHSAGRHVRRHRAMGRAPGRTSRRAARRVRRLDATCTSRCTIGGSRINPVPFMADRGVYLG